MTLLSRSRVLPALFIAVGFVALTSVDRPVDQLIAGPNDPFLDSDGDLLPDTLEWVLMSNPWKADTDGDGVDDFLEAVQFQLPRTTPPPPSDHEFRVVTHIVRLPDNSQHVIVNLMFRIANGDPGEVSSLIPYLDVQGQKYPFGAAFMMGLVHFNMKLLGNEGLYLVLSSRLCAPEELKPFLPCSVGGLAVIGQRPFNNGSVLLQGDGTVVSFAEIANAHFGLHPIDSEFLNDPNEPQAGFWQKSKVCELELVVEGAGGGFSLAQVVEAACTGAPTLGCAPSCDSWRSRLVVLPDTNFLTGH